MENAIILVTIVKDYSGKLVFDLTIMSNEGFFSIEFVIVTFFVGEKCPNIGVP